PCSSQLRRAPPCALPPDAAADTPPSAPPPRPPPFLPPRLDQSARVPHFLAAEAIVHEGAVGRGAHRPQRLRARSGRVDGHGPPHPRQVRGGAPPRGGLAGEGGAEKDKALAERRGTRRRASDVR